MAQTVVATSEHRSGRRRTRTTRRTRTPGVSNNKLAIWVFLASESLFFGAFIATYFLYRGRDAQFLKGPTPDQLLNIPFTSVTSFVLLMSSLTMVLALAAIQRGDHRRFRIWILATALFGMTFIGGQVYEFTEFYREGLHLGTNLFGTTFFVLTGLHGAHVDDRHRVAALALGPVDAGPAGPGEARGGRDRRPLLALRRRRVDLHLHRRLPDSRSTDGARNERHRSTDRAPTSPSRPT